MVLKLESLEFKLKLLYDSLGSFCFLMSLLNEGNKEMHLQYITF